MRKLRGFTLIEVMIVVAIIAILAAVAYPTYQGQVMKTRRSDAKAALAHASQLQERLFTQNGSYSNIINNVGGTVSAEGYYTLSVAIPGTAGCSSGGKFYCYQMTAAPTGPQAGDDCGSFTFDHTGLKNVTGGTLPRDQCW